jgi:hypothetical protein
MDMLEQLAIAPVPPVPTAPSFTAGVRRKLHPRLLALHVLEFAVGGMLWSLLHMAAAVAAAAAYTVTGAWPTTRGDAGRNAPDGGGRTGS